MCGIIVIGNHNFFTFIDAFHNCMGRLPLSDLE